MTGAATSAARDAAAPRIQDLAAAMLDCAEQPTVDVAAARALLDSASLLNAVRPADAPSEELAGFTLRQALVTTAEGLLDRSDLIADGNLWRISTRAVALAEAWWPLFGMERTQANALRLRHGLGLMTSAPPDQLAADMRRYRDEPLELLSDAHLLVRLAAAAWHVADHGEGSLAQVAVLLEQDEPELAAVTGRVAVWEPPFGHERSEAELLRSIARFRSLQATLLPMADADTPATALMALATLLPQWLGQAVVPLWVEGSDWLRVYGNSDLAGQRIRLQNGRSLAALAVLRRASITQHHDAAAARSEGRSADNGVAATVVFDRQCAERLGDAGLLAVPVGAPEPVAVLLTAAHVEAEEMNLAAIHAARWLERLASVETRLEHAAAEQRVRFTRRLREAVHEISNPLAVIQNYLHLLGVRIDAADPAQEQIGLISEELKRATALLRSMTEDATEEASLRATVHGAVELNALVSDVLALIGPSLGPGAGTEVRFTPGVGLPEVEIVAQHLRQVLMNLARNAVDAMPDGGVLEVALDPAIDDRGRRGVEIRVADTGEGMHPDLLAHIFEAGVSVKGEGRGLGLAITRELVRDLGGEISCRSRAGAGTSFLIWLPSAA